jgi:hypothetical protein
MASVSAELASPPTVTKIGGAVMGQYQELCGPTTKGIQPRLLAEAASYLRHVFQEEPEPSRGLDHALFGASTRVDDPVPLLCLRCRISHALEAWLRAIHRTNQERYGLELLAMASYALDDEGKLTIRTGPKTEQPFTYAELASLPNGLISPFSAEILRSYNSELCGLPHWARLKIQAHNGLKAYFKQHGLLLISDWALLRHSSGKRVREACERHLRSTSSVEAVRELHACYLPLYDQALKEHKARTGKAAGWQPTLADARELDSERDPFDTIALLKSVATAIRQYVTGSTTQSLDQAAEAGRDPVDPRSLPQSDSDGVDRAELQGLIDAALQRAMDQHMPQVLSAGGKNIDLLRCLWAGWAEGLTNRPLAERCGTTPGTISKAMRPTEHATAIATTAAIELKRHEAFASCGASVEAAERLVGALRNHLLEPERDGDIAPLRRWVQTHLSQA